MTWPSLINARGAGCNKMQKMLHLTEMDTREEVGEDYLIEGKAVMDVRQELAAGIGRALINAQITARLKMTLYKQLTRELDTSYACDARSGLSYRGDLT